ncbi:hypothetical protein ECC02_011149 [Trypanosoma cruzi]|uniref:Uncharacterized protein n=1 Tax=Trypanosoma cruzi TaxID=5693 RepID=A0A7J6XL45_TRYCR|nr:hypothetical protein ECC02_012700 [Trypanosoma cruzi]KAF5216113.1 hypothetical protein ECC02_011149 [Trypanosoma cruzi]
MESNRGDERCGRHTQRAHHMRRGQQPGMHRTPHTTHDTHSNPRQQAHTPHSPATTPTHRWKREKQTGAAHKAPPHVHTARAVRRVCTPHGGCAHTHEEVQRTQQHKSKVIIKKEIPAHHVNCWSTGSAANIHHKATCYLDFGLRSYSAHTTSCRHSHHRSSSTTKNARREWNNASNHLFVFLFECWQMSACVLFCLCGRQTFMPGSCVGDFCRVHNLFSFLL